MAVCSSDRTVLSDLPMSLTSLTSAAYLAVVIEGVLLAIGVVAFFVGVVRLSNSARSARIWGRLAGLAGITVALALVAAGLTPANRFPSLHVAAALTAFRGAAVAAAFLVLATAQDRRFPVCPSLSP